MNLQKLFKVQAELDKKIIEEKGLQGQDLLDKKILALQVELGELANEWRGFKFWVDNQNPNVDASCDLCDGKGEKTVTISDFHPSHGYAIHYELAICPKCKGNPIYKNPLLEEYVDCLHFILSIGNDIGITEEETFNHDGRKKEINKTFVDLFVGTGVLLYRNQPIKTNYVTVFNDLLNLGKMLGFTWKQIEQAYFEKNKCLT